MANKSTNEQDKFGVILEQLRKTQAAMRVLMRGIQDSRNKAWEWRDRRDEFRAETPVVHDEISSQKVTRDELNAEVQRQKKLRDEANEHARLLQEKLQELREKSSNQRDYVPLEDLQHRFRGGSESHPRLQQRFLDSAQGWRSDSRERPDSRDGPIQLYGRGEQRLCRL